jgi:hypothetical protein
MSVANIDKFFASVFCDLVPTHLATDLRGDLSESFQTIFWTTFDTRMSVTVARMLCRTAANESESYLGSLLSVRFA